MPRRSLGRSIREFAEELRQFSAQVSDGTGYLKRVTELKPCAGGAGPAARATNAWLRMAMAPHAQACMGLQLGTAGLDAHAPMPTLRPHKGPLAAKRAPQHWQASRVRSYGGRSMHAGRSWW